MRILEKLPDHDFHIIFLGFHILATVSNAAMKIGVQVSVRVPAFNPLGYIPPSRLSMGLWLFLPICLPLSEKTMLSS